MTKYNYKIICGNCLESEVVEIDFGTTVKDFRENFICENCGVKNG